MKWTFAGEAVELGNDKRGLLLLTELLSQGFLCS
jgi:hypothetical protein